MEVLMCGTGLCCDPDGNSISDCQPRAALHGQVKRGKGNQSSGSNVRWSSRQKLPSRRP